MAQVETTCSCAATRKVVPEQVAVVETPVGPRRFLHERPEQWQHEENRLRAQRRHEMYALTFGPNDFNQLSDAELRLLFDAGGREQGVWDIRTGAPTGVWPETTWARQRYIEGLSVATRVPRWRRPSGARRGSTGETDARRKAD
jgi:hypothetical protein